MKHFIYSILCILLCPLATAAPENNGMTAEVEKTVVRQTNEFRQKEGLSELSEDTELTKAAADFASFMAETSKYGHHADGRTPSARAKKAGYRYCIVRENIAYRINSGEVTASSLSDVFMLGWIDSPSHRDNMLADYVTHTGVAIATTDQTTFYAVQMFGRPKSAAIKLRVSNESGELQTLVMEAGDSSDEIELPPRTTVTISQCIPTTLFIDEKSDGITLRETAELVITDQGITQK